MRVRLSISLQHTKSYEALDSLFATRSSSRHFEDGSKEAHRGPFVEGIEDGFFCSLLEEASTVALRNPGASSY